jgi:hypothetical protein
MLRWDDIAMTTVQLDHLKQNFCCAGGASVPAKEGARMSIRIVFRSRRKTDRNDVGADEANACDHDDPVKSDPGPRRDARPWRIPDGAFDGHATPPHRYP